MLQRKINSDRKNDTDALTFENTKKGSSHGAAARRVRDIRDGRHIERLADDNSYYDYLLEDK